LIVWKQMRRTEHMGMRVGRALWKSPARLFGVGVRRITYGNVSHTGLAVSFNSRRQALCPLQDVKTAAAVDEIDQAALVDEHVVAGEPPRAFRRVRHEAGDFLRGVRLRDIDDAQP